MALFHHVHEEDPSAEAEQSFKPVTSPDHKSTASRKVMLRQMLINSTAAAGGFDMMTQTHASPTLNVSQGPVSVSAFLKPTGRSGALREGELNKPDLTTYIVMCLVLFLMVLLIVFFINCQLRNSFFASMPYDRSLREARSSYK